MFHVSPVLIKPGTVLRWGNRGYVCLCTTKEQAIYWAAVLWGRSSGRGHRARCFVYRVRIGGDGMVEDCRGHYSFEYRGDRKKAVEVEPHTDRDGEVVTDRPVIVQDVIGIVPITPEVEGWARSLNFSPWSSLLGIFYARVS